MFPVWETGIYCEGSVCVAVFMYSISCFFDFENTYQLEKMRFSLKAGKVKTPSPSDDVFIIMPYQYFS